jgi:Bcr/CflA subfamily drug resistance transporter
MAHANNAILPPKTSVPYVWLAGLSMLGFLATDMYLPAFDLIRQSLGTTQQLVGWTLTIFLLGMAGGQLVYGPLVNRFAQRKVLVGSLLVFSVGTLLCALSSTIEMLLLGRFIQAAGACGSTIIWQAFVMEKYDAKTSQKVFATIMPLVALSPALAPLLGATLQSYYGWSAIFFTLIGLGVFLISRALDVDFPRHKNVQSTTEKQVSALANYASILKSKKFIANMMVFAACSGAFFAWLAGSPFVMTEMGYSGTDIGLSYVPQTIAFLIGGFGCRALLNKYEPSIILPKLIMLFSASVIVMFIVAIQFTTTSIVPLLVPLCFLALANGAIYPIVVNQALSAFKNNSASAAGLLNFLQMMFCVISSAIVSMFNTPTAITGTMLISVVAVTWAGVMLKKESASSNLPAA